MDDVENVCHELGKSFEKNLASLSMAIASDVEPATSHLLTFEQQAKRIELALAEENKKFYEKCARGIEACLPSLDETQTNSLIEAFQTIKSVEKSRELAKQVVKGVSWSTLLHIAPGIMEGLYKEARRLLENLQFEEAEGLFSFLALLDHTQFYYWLGLAHAHFHAGHLEEASRFYKIAISLAPQDSNAVEMICKRLEGISI